MASDKSYLDFIIEQLSDLGEVSYRPMMGEYILYYQGKVFGGIYDNRFLVKETPSALRMMLDAQHELPYPGAKTMLLVNEVDSSEFLRGLVCAIAKELPESKPRKHRKS